ncbi:enoyl-CoA hydratase/isomerase family protein [Solwaraspora sp. WMMD1047]|uniref:enoyl-CoA hydratase/isomerase family protein n=1 Tax=Solwaraspora sp. WMMD1047 TaxID=3016102 RepID=UPI00241643D1|nr:enoyl-CoA hydratase/isomerase family protein [Solwaraspora sp. WMMD1047]MDG4834316.1 enoyl-CoA hydratase/isomerase family protein [Solwaraspora sp. WMMD1047]
MTGGPLLLERREATLLLTLNRPDRHNALNAALLTALDAAVDTAVADRGVRAVVITGAGGRSFCAGADLDELTEAGDAATVVDVLAVGQRVFSRLCTAPVPVIAAVNGLALGGGFELALATTFIIGSERASFALPETGLGLLPGYGGTQRLPRLVGRQLASYLVTTGTRWDAPTAHARGLLAEPPLPPDRLLDRALELAGAIAARGPRATRLALGLLAHADGIESGLARETATAALTTAGSEAREGIAAFRQRRPAVFE